MIGRRSTSQKTLSGGGHRLRIVFGILAAAIVSAAGVISCKKPPASLADRGRIVYQGTCIACHNMDPAKDGTMGPSIKGASLELITARVTAAAYPPGYQPKRQTKLMPKQNLTPDEIHAVYEFLK